MEMENEIIHHKRGYLHKDFEFFHLKDKKNMQLEFHFHDFNKIIIFMSGKVTYLIEGKAYKLKPWDILLVNSNEIHQPLIDAEHTYERIVIWVNSLFLTKHNYLGCNLLTCFQMASQEKMNLLRLNPDGFSGIKKILLQLDDACKSQEFGSQLLKNSLFLQFIVYLNRIFLGHKADIQNPDIGYDETVGNLLQYINSNLCEDLSTDKVASVCHLSKYYLMRKFKQQTGYTIHNYILQKRLIAATALIKEGKSVTQVCLECGFGDYSNFIRSFKQVYGVSPKKHYKNLMQYENAKIQNNTHSPNHEL
jgi:AraC-like DNA-binding protein